MPAAAADLAERSLLMPASFRRRAIVAMALAVALSLPSAMAASSLAAGFPLLRATPAIGGVVTRLWSWFAAWWPDNGCGADPNGGCAASAPAPKLRPQEGCSADPNGGCARNAPAPPVRPQESCGIDPNGRCGSALATHRSRASVKRP
jgi:hypothetical protein